MKNIISWEDFLKVLAVNHLDNMTDHAKRYVFTEFTRHQLSKEDVFSIISGAKQKMIFSEKDGKFVRINLVKLVSENFSEIDIALYRRLDEIISIFKDYHRSRRIKQENFTAGLRDCWKLAKRINEKNNFLALDFTEEQLNTLEILANIYKSIAEHVENVPVVANIRKTDENENYIKSSKTNHYQVEEKRFERVADYIVGTRIAELCDNTLSRFTLETAKTFDEFLKSITSTEQDNARDVFTKDDVKNLLDKTISVIGHATAEKYKVIRDNLNVYIDGVCKLFAREKESAEYEEFSKLTAKNILTRCSRLFYANPESVSLTLDFMMGKSMESICQSLQNSAESETSTTSKYAKLLKSHYGNLKLVDMDLKSHLYFAKSNASFALSITTSSLYNTTTFLVDSILTGLGKNVDKLTVPEKNGLLYRLGFNVNTMYNKDNLFELLSNSFFKEINQNPKQMGELISENISILSQYILPSQLHKVFSHNFSILIADPTIIQEKLEEIKNQSQDNDEEFIKLFHEVINDSYQPKEQKYTASTSSSKTGIKKNSSTSNDSVDEPEKEYIQVEIIGKTKKEEVDIDDANQDTQPIETFDEKLAFVTGELEELFKYGIYTVKETDSSNTTFIPNTIAYNIANIENITDYKHRVDKSIQKFSGLIDELQGMEEFDFLAKTKIHSLIYDAISALDIKKRALIAESDKIDAETVELVSREKDKTQRRKSKVYTDSTNAIQTLINNGFAHLLDNSKVDDVILEKMILDEENENVRSARQDQRISKNLEDYFYLTKEREFVEMLMDKLNNYFNQLENSLIKEDLDIEQQEEPTVTDSKIISEEDCLNMIKYLENQKELKIRNLKGAYSSRIRNNDFDADDFESIVGKNPHGRRILDAIRKIESEIEKYRKILNDFYGSEQE